MTTISNPHGIRSMASNSQGQAALDERAIECAVEVPIAAYETAHSGEQYLLLVRDIHGTLGFAIYDEHERREMASRGGATRPSTNAAHSEPSLGLRAAYIIVDLVDLSQEPIEGALVGMNERGITVDQGADNIVVITWAHIGLIRNVRWRQSTI